MMQCSSSDSNRLSLDDTMEVTQLHVKVNRPVVYQLDLYAKYRKLYNGEDERHRAENDDDDPMRNRNCCVIATEACCKVGRIFHNFDIYSWFQRRLPITAWLKKYNWKDDLMADLIAGFTVSVLQIPQGMAYAMLAGLPPIIGIYMAFFPIFVYILMGSSRHVSMGTFAVICLMTGKVVQEIVNHNSLYTPVQVATSVSIVTGICQIFMGIFRLGAISLLLSPSLVGGFTTGAAVHVATSQLTSLLGLKLGKRSGMFKIPLTIYDVTNHISEANQMTLIIAAGTVTTITCYNLLVQPFIAKYTKIPFPIELIAIVAATAASNYFDLTGTYGISIIGKVPTGLPVPTIPPLELFNDIIVDCLIIGFVSYAVSISMAKIFAKRHRYTVDSDQELIAHGFSNVFGSFFSCAPVSASLSRSLVQEKVGGKTQLASLFACFLLLLVLLWVGPLFQALPNCILASIIVVALKGMFLQAMEFPTYWSTSTFHGLIWFASFAGTVVLDIQYGLLIGLTMAVVILLWRSNRSKVAVLGRCEEFDLFVELDAGHQVKEVPQMKIIKYTGSLNFATLENFMEQLNKIIDVDQLKNNKGLKLSKSRSMGSRVAIVFDEELQAEDDISDEAPIDQVRWLIIDFSSASSIGPGSVKALHQLYHEFDKKGIKICHVGCPLTVLEEMEKCQLIRRLGYDSLFPTIHDAVTACQIDITLSDIVHFGEGKE